MHDMEDEFEIIAGFTHWLRILPHLKNYKRHTYCDNQGFLMGYFKLKS